jgi:hypothetical protein
MDLRVTGADQFAAVSRQLREAGEKDLRREMYRALGSAAKQMTPEVKAALPSYLPDRYAGVLAGSLKMRATGRGGKNPSVKIVGTAKGRKSARVLGALESGGLRHLTYGRRPWHAQSVRAGFFTDPIDKHADIIRRELLDALDRITRKLSR